MFTTFYDMIKKKLNMKGIIVISDAKNHILSPLAAPIRGHRFRCQKVGPVFSMGSLLSGFSDLNGFQ